MASALIKAARSVTGAQPDHRRLPEDAAMTFLDGVPVTLNTTTGGINEWDGTTYTGAIAGFSAEGASNLTTVNVPKTLTYGSVPNQPAAVKIPMGAPLNDGRIEVAMAVSDTIFHGQVKSDQLFAITDVGKSYGMTKDSDNHWYVDKTKGTPNIGVIIVGGDQFDTRGVYFRVLAAAQQQIA